jgi:hypothetical protein
VSSLAEVGHASTSFSHTWRDVQEGLLVWSSKPGIEGLLVWAGPPVCGRLGGLSLKITGGRFSGLGLDQNQGAVPAGIRGGTWCLHETCIEAKLSIKGVWPSD